MVLASLEQYLLVNSSNLSNGTADNLTMMQLVNLYSFLRGFGRMSNQVSHSREAERVLFQLINDDGWDILSSRIHSVSLKWLFQQENITKSLCRQILNFCRSYSSEGADVLLDGNNDHTVSVQTLAELVSTEDNYGARIFVSLLAQLVEEEAHEHDIISVLNLMTNIIHICPVASDQLCLHGVGTAIRTLCYSNHTFSTTIFTFILALVFGILSSVHSETISADQCWVSVTLKVSD